VAKRHIEARCDQWREESLKGAKRYLLQYAKPLHDRPIDTLKRADIAALVRDITQKHGRPTARRARGNLSAMFSWAMGEGLVENNLVIGTNDPGAGVPPRDRVLSDGELRIVLKSCPGNENYTNIIWLLALTGCRRMEIIGMKWEELDLEAGLLILPAKRVKNKHAFTLPLPNKAIEILKAIPRREGHEQVFTARAEAGWSFTNYAYWKIYHDKQIVIDTGKPIPHWRIHDIRRTVRTGLGKLGVRPDVAERCLNHVKGGIEAVYDKYRYLPEMKTALAMWADHVEAVFNGTESKIVPMFRSA
jgi:integrase